MNRPALAAALAVHVDADVALTFTVRNMTPAPVQLSFPSALRCDFVVRAHGSDDELWRWSDGRMFAAMLGARTLAPGETMECSARWTPASPAPTGALTATATLASSSHRVEASADFTLP